MNIRAFPKLILVLLFLFVLIQVNAQNSEIVITNVDASAFPMVNLALTVRQNGRPVADLTPNDFQFNEQHETPVNIQAIYEQPLEMAVIIDLANGSNLDLIQNTLRAWFSNYYREGDQVTFYIMDRYPHRRVSLDSLTAIQTQIDNLNLGSGRVASVGDGFSAASRELYNSNTSYTKVGLYVGSYIGGIAPSVDENLFGSYGIPLYIAQSHRNRGSSTTTFREIANTAGGHFVDNSNGRYVAAVDGLVKPLQELETMYGTMNSNRISYLVSYKSQNLDTNPTRDVTLSVRGASTSFSYAPIFQPPVVAIDGTSILNPVRNQKITSDDGAVNYDLDEVNIIAQVTFPDNLPRAISKATLEIQDNSATPPIILSNVQLDSNGKFIIPWNLRNYNLSGVTTDVVLVLTIEDAATNIATTQATGKVQVNPPVLPPTNTPVPTNTLVPTNTPAPTATPASNLFGAGVAREVDQVVTVSLFGTLAAALVAIVVLAVLLQRSRAVQYVASRATQVVKTTVQRARTQIFERGSTAVNNRSNNGGRSGKVYGELFVISHDVSGLENVSSIQINRQEFTIGRELKAGCNYAIANTFISSRHCTFYFREGDGFSIQDEGSTNYTEVDKMRLRANERKPLQHGSRILLGGAVELELRVPKAVHTEIADRDNRPESSSTKSFIDSDTDETEIDPNSTVNDEEPTRTQSYDDGELPSRSPARGLNSRYEIDDDDEGEVDSNWADNIR